MRIRFNTGTQLLRESMILKKIELVQVKRQIEVLVTFLPDEILNMENDEIAQIHTFVGVLLFADVSGFTPLTEKYNKTGKGGIYRLTATLNAYIGAIVEVLYFYGGDVLKFSGDAFLALWKVKEDESLYEILHTTVVCALLIQHTLGYFETEVNVALKVKLAIACGNMTFSVIGDDLIKHYIIIGEAINDVKRAEHTSSSGEVVISPTAWSHMFHNRYQCTQAEGGHIKVWKIIYKDDEYTKKAYFDDKRTTALKLIQAHINHRNQLHTARKFDSNLTHSNITEQFIRDLPQRKVAVDAPKRWIVDQLRAFIIKPVQDQVDESQPVEYLTEMREVTIQFINIVPQKVSDAHLVKIVNRAYKKIGTIVGRLLAVVNKVSLFDKDLMLLVLFGLRGIKHELESQHALRSAYSIRKTLLEIEGVKGVSIGITHGLVYCGVVGHPLRREYSVIGTVVNKAARMMCHYPDKVTCDQQTFRYSKLSSFYFQLQTAIKMKGIEDPGNIFEYNEEFDMLMEEAGGKVKIIGRETEYNLIRSIIYGEFTDYTGVCFHGPEKIGKSAILQLALEPLKASKSFNIASVDLTNSLTIPYFCISQIYRQLYDSKMSINQSKVNFKNIPRELCNVREEFLPSEDVALVKYRILNNFRDLVTFCSKNTIIFIDNIQYIDIQSWEIIEIVFNEDLMKLVITGYFEEDKWDLKFNISLNDKIKMIEVKKLNPKYTAALVCLFLESSAIPKTLEQLLRLATNGYPGYIQSCLLRLINNGSIEMQLISPQEVDLDYYIFPFLSGDHEMPTIFPIIDFSDKYKQTTDELTQSAISLDLFDSFAPYQQLVIKTGSVLGDLFTRTLLTVALKYPTENILAKVIQQLFEEEVFDCGSRYLYANEISTKKLCCRCYFEPEFLVDKAYPKYAYCKIIHFKNKSIRNVAYSILPGNQKVELHLLCTEVLDNTLNRCPVCLRQPLNGFLNICKFKDIMKYCNNPGLEYYEAYVTTSRANEIKDVIRNVLKISTKSNMSDISEMSTNNEMVSYNPNDCNCFEILAKILKDLIHHSFRARSLGKKIFYTMQYGFLLIIMNDYLNAIKYLTEAREMCLVNAKMKSSQISELFRRLHIGKIETALCRCFIALGQYKAAKNHLAIALRQYNIPSIALAYKFYSNILLKSFLVNRRLIKFQARHNNILQNDLGKCMAFCSQIFAKEGHWRLAKLTSAYSIYLLRSCNENVNMLFQVYSNAIDIYRYCADFHTVYCLQLEVLKQLQLKYANGETYNLNLVTSIISNCFDIHIVKGDVQAAIRIGFRVLDFSYKVQKYFMDYMLLVNLGVMLYHNFRIKDAGNMCKLLERHSRSDSKCFIAFQVLCANMYLQTSFAYIPMNDIMQSTYDHLRVTNGKITFLEHFLIAIIHLYLVRVEKYQQAEEWNDIKYFTPANVQREIVFKCLICHIEVRILLYLRNLRNQSTATGSTLEQKNIDKLFIIFKKQVHRQYVFYAPLYYSMFAWWIRIFNKKRQANGLLGKAYKLAEGQKNYLMMAQIIQMKNSWTGVTSYVYDENYPNINYNKAAAYSVNQWSQNLYHYPLS